MVGPDEVINGTRFPVSQSTACFSLALTASYRTRGLEHLKGQKYNNMLDQGLALSIHGPRTFSLGPHTHHTPWLPLLLWRASNTTSAPCISYVSSQGQKSEDLENHFDRQPLSDFLQLDCIWKSWPSLLPSQWSEGH